MKRMSVRGLAGIILVCILCLTGTLMNAEAANGEMLLISSEGKVSLRSMSGRSYKCYENMKLPHGSLLETGETGRAKVSVGAEGELLLEKCGKLAFRTSKGVPEVLLGSGELFFELSGEGDIIYIRTPVSAMAVENAKGSIRIVDWQRTLIVLEEGEIRCSVTDPLSGQTKTATLSSGKVAECVVYADKEGEDRCAILIVEPDEKGKMEEESGKPALQPELAAFRDPVWTEDRTLADASETADTEQRTEEEAAGENEAEDQDRPGKQDGVGTPGNDTASAIPNVPADEDSGNPPISGDNADTEDSPASGDSAGTGNSSSSGGNSDSGNTTSSPAKPEPSPVSPTKDKGLVVNTGSNYGVIQSCNGGKIVVGSEEKKLYNYGNIEIQANGSMDGEIANCSDNDYSPTATVYGTVRKVSNTDGGGSIIISGGIVEEGAVIEGGTFSMDKSSILYASSGDKECALKVSGSSEVKLEEGKIVNEHGGNAVYVQSGNVSIGAGVTLMAREPLKTLKVEPNREALQINYTAGDGSTDSWTWEDNWEWRWGFPALYVTQEIEDGDVVLCTLRDKFFEAAEDIKTGGAYTITLSGSVTEEYEEPKVYRYSGTKDAPITLDLNGNFLIIINYNYEDTSIVLENSSFWKIKGNKGRISAEQNLLNMCVTGDSEVEITGAEIGGSLCSEGNGRITVSNGSTIRRGVDNRGGYVSVSDSQIDYVLGNSGSGGVVTINRSTLDQAAIWCDEGSETTISECELEWWCDIDTESGGVLRLLNCQEVIVSYLRSDATVYIENCPMVSISGSMKSSCEGRIEILNSGVHAIDMLLGSNSRVNLSNSKVDIFQEIFLNNAVLTMKENSTMTVTGHQEEVRMQKQDVSTAFISTQQDEEEIGAQGYINLSNRSQMTISDSVLNGGIVVQDSFLSVSKEAKICSWREAAIKIDCGNSDIGELDEYIRLNGATVTNEGWGAGIWFIYKGDDEPELNWSSLIANNQIRTRIRDSMNPMNPMNPIQVGWYNNFKMPEGYTIEERGDGYRYPVEKLSSRIAESAFLSLLPEASMSDLTKETVEKAAEDEATEEETADKEAAEDKEETTIIEEADIPKMEEVQGETESEEENPENEAGT